MTAWAKMTAEQRVEAVRPLEAEGHANSIITFKLNAVRKDIDRICRFLRMEQETAGPEQEDSQAKASEDNGATGEPEHEVAADSATGDASRPSRGGGTPAEIHEQRDTSLSQHEGGVDEHVAQATVRNTGVTAGETAPVSDRPAYSAGDGGSRGIPRDDARGAGRGSKVPSLRPQSTRAATDYPDWTRLTAREKADAVLPMVHEGMTMTAIAARFTNCSPGAIVGAINRMRKAGVVVPSNKQNGGRPRTAKEPRRKPKPSEPIIRISRASAFDPIPGTTPVTIMELGSTTCRWPVSGREPVASEYCGQACPVDQPYCASHAELSRSHQHERAA
ncbi:MAG: GcrA family cell cycle regulator [Rhizobiaceae bacterium]|nr:GcrA family cell cycle regulator [Rhizobiaceae bacterium]MCV0408915.1 GcrA family cell cycle regulator [Rhizobiaceae bacterium]